MSFLNSPIHLAEIESVLAWVDTFKLSRPTKKINRDFSDAVLLAEILHKHYPKMVEMHNYPPRSGHALKMNNWMTLNRKVLKKLKINLSGPVLDQLANSAPGMIERVLVMVHDKIKKDEEQHKKETEQVSSGGSYYEACGDDDHILVVPVKSRVNGVLETVHQKVVNHETYITLKEELKDAKDTIDVLKQKVEHLDNLLKLKEERIEELQKQLDRKATRRKDVQSFHNSLNVPFENGLETTRTDNLLSEPNKVSMSHSVRQLINSKSEDGLAIPQQEEQKNIATKKPSEEIVNTLFATSIDVAKVSLHDFTKASTHDVRKTSSQDFTRVSKHDLPKSNHDLAKISTSDFSKVSVHEMTKMSLHDAPQTSAHDIPNKSSMKPDERTSKQKLEELSTPVVKFTDFQDNRVDLPKAIGEIFKQASRHSIHNAPSVHQPLDDRSSVTQIPNQISPHKSYTSLIPKLNHTIVKHVDEDADVQRVKSDVFEEAILDFQKNENFVDSEEFIESEQDRVVTIEDSIKEEIRDIHLTIQKTNSRPEIPS